MCVCVWRGREHAYVEVYPQNSRQLTLGFEVGDLEFEIEALCQNQAQAVRHVFPFGHIVFLGETNSILFFLSLALPRTTHHSTVLIKWLVINGEHE